MSIIVNRSRVIFLVIGLVTLAGFGIWFFHPDRTLRRTWNGLLGAVEARQAVSVRSYLADDYSDRWGYDRESLAAEARLAFQHFTELRVRPTKINIERTGDAARISATIRIEAAGSTDAFDAQNLVNALAAPFTTVWRRRPGLLNGWELTTFDHPELNLHSFRRRMPGASPL